MPYSHFMMDAYGSVDSTANDLKSINELLVGATVELGLEPVMPPFLIPYYYCDDPFDEGLSAINICRGGHVTIHTFPNRSCYFVDVLTENEIDRDKVTRYFQSRLHASLVDSRVALRDELYGLPEPPIDKEKDFGPHYMIELENVELSYEWIYNWLDSVAFKVDMHPITRPYVIKDRREGARYISGLIVVAQSHIAVHYDVMKKKALVDIFSCVFLDDSAIRSVLDEAFGKNYKCYLISRGSKYDHRADRRSARIKESTNWLDNI